MNPLDGNPLHDTLRPDEGRKSTDFLKESYLLDILPAAVIVCDSEGIIKKYNRHAAELWGRSPEPGGNDERFCREFRLYNPDGTYLTYDKTPIAQCLKDGLPKKESEAIIERPDSSRIHVRMSVVPIRDVTGSLVGALNYFQDITHQKETEKELREKQVVEERKKLTKVLSRTEELKKVNVSLQNYNEQLEQFAYAASHDLREPLRKIHIFNNRIKDAAGAQLPEHARQYLDRSIETTQRMQTLLDNLLMYTRITTGPQKNELVDLNKIIEEVVVSHRQTIEDLNANIELQQLPFILGVPFQLQQLFDNLIGNALKYYNPSRQTCITITSGEAAGEVVNQKEADPQTKYFKISVQDNGIGFEQEYSDQIFEIFQRLHGKNQFSGAGVGLGICKRIVHNHRGFIKATGKVNEGAVFEIYFPELQLTIDKKAIVR